MKIRTGFVTNSSSYCSAEVVIDNPVLLEILQKYKNDVKAISIFRIGNTFRIMTKKMEKTLRLTVLINLRK